MFWCVQPSWKLDWIFQMPIPLIVDNAQNYGLSQLHQLRGRVGRGRERAYAYFLYPTDKSLGEVAHERLKAVATP